MAARAVAKNCRVSAESAAGRNADTDNHYMPQRPIHVLCVPLTQRHNAISQPGVLFSCVAVTARGTFAPRLRALSPRHFINRSFGGFVMPSLRFDQNIFELQPLEVRRFLTTAVVDADNTLQSSAPAGNETITVNRNAANRITVTGVADDVRHRQRRGGRSTRSSSRPAAATTPSCSPTTSASPPTTPASPPPSPAEPATTPSPAGRATTSSPATTATTCSTAASATTKSPAATNFDTTNYSIRTGRARRRPWTTSPTTAKVAVGENDNVTRPKRSSAARATTPSSAPANADFIGGGGGNDSMTGGDGNDQHDRLRRLRQVLRAERQRLPHRPEQRPGHGQRRDELRRHRDTDLASIDPVDVAAAVMARAAAAAGARRQRRSTTPTTPTASPLGPANLGWTPDATAVDAQGRVYFAGTDVPLQRQRLRPRHRRRPLHRHRRSSTPPSAAAASPSSTSPSSTAPAPVTATTTTSGGGMTDRRRRQHHRRRQHRRSVRQRQRLRHRAPHPGRHRSIPSTSTTAACRPSTSSARRRGLQRRSARRRRPGDGKIVVVGESSTSSAANSTVAVARLHRRRPDRQLRANPESPLQRQRHATVTASATVDVSATAVALQPHGRRRAHHRRPATPTTSRADPRRRRAARSTSASAATTASSPADLRRHRRVINDLAVNSQSQIVAVGNATALIIIGVDGAVAPQGPPTVTGRRPRCLLARRRRARCPRSAAAPGRNGFISFNGVAIDDDDRIVVAGTEDGDYVVARFACSTATTTAPPSTTTTPSPPAWSTPISRRSRQQPVRRQASAPSPCADGKIVVAGWSIVLRRESHDLRDPLPAATTAAPTSRPTARARSPRSKNSRLRRPPRPRTRPTSTTSPRPAKFYTLSQHDDNGVARLDLPPELDKANVITIYNVLAGDGEINVAVNVDGLVLYYDPDDCTRIEIYSKRLQRHHHRRQRRRHPAGHRRRRRQRHRHRRRRRRRRLRRQGQRLHQRQRRRRRRRRRRRQRQHPRLARQRHPDRRHAAPT